MTRAERKLYEVRKAADAVTQLRSQALYPHPYEDGVFRGKDTNVFGWPLKLDYPPPRGKKPNLFPEDDKRRIIILSASDRPIGEVLAPEHLRRQVALTLADAVNLMQLRRLMDPKSVRHMYALYRHLKGIHQAYEMLP